MSTPRQGMAGTGSDAPRTVEDIGDELTDPLPPEKEAEARARAVAKLGKDIPADTTLLTSRVPESIAFDLVLDPDTVIKGGSTPSGFVIWFCPNKLVERMKRHTLVQSGRIVLPEGMSLEPKPKPAPEQPKTVKT